MNPLIQCKATILPLFIAGVLACIGLLPRAQAVSPAPDGGYPNFTTAEGQNALLSLTTGAANTAVGWSSLLSNAGGSFNTATGAGALLLNNGDPSTGQASQNTAFGAAALLFNTTGSSNTGVGVAALLHNTTGNANIALGYNAGANILGHDNIDIGSAGADTDSATTRIGQEGSQTLTFIAGIRGRFTQYPDAVPVVIDSAGQLGTMSSSRRYKKEIKPMDQTSEAILGLKPVTFHYKSDKTNTSQFGLIAEEVAAVNPNLVIRDKDGEIYTVRYDAVNAMLLNEFLKEHRKNEKQQATITQLKSAVAQQEKKFQATAAQQQQQIETLTTGLQKVNAQLEATKPAPQVVNNP